MRKPPDVVRTKSRACVDFESELAMLSGKVGSVGELFT